MDNKTNTQREVLLPDRPSVPGSLRGTNWLIFLVTVLPAALFYFRLGDSYALGTVVVVLIALMLRLSQGTVPTGGLGAPHWPLMICFCIALHLVMVSWIQPVAWARALVTLPFLFFMLLGGAYCAALLCKLPENSFHRQLRNLGFFMLAVAILGLLGVVPPTLGGTPWSRPFFPFAEPAGFAIPLAPILIYIFVSSKIPQRKWLLALTLLGAGLITTLTLVAVLVLAVMTTLKKKHLIVFVLFTAIAITQLDLEYYSERLDFFSPDNTNLSNLVYVQGWQLLLEALERSSLFGQGFQQLGMHGTNAEAAIVINEMMQGADLNILDGGFLLPKLGAEFGVVGLVLAAWATKQAVQSGLILRRVAMGQLQLPAVIVFAHAVLTALLIRLYVRSGGYFNGEMFLTITAIWILMHSRSNPKHLKKSRI